MMIDNEIKEAYREDTIEKKIHPSIISKMPIESEKELNKHNSDVKEYNLNVPIVKREFQKLPDKIKKMYIENLREIFGVNNSEIARMMGYDNSYIGKVCKKLGLKTPSKRAKTPQQAKAWKAFLRTTPYTGIEIPSLKDVPSPAESTKKQTLKSICRNCKFELYGELDCEELVHRIKAMIPEGTMCKIHIGIQTITEENGGNHAKIQ